MSLAQLSRERRVNSSSFCWSGTWAERDGCEIAVDRWLDTAAQVAVLFLEVLLVDEQEAFEVLRESSIENRAFGMA
jgi:hypothetical protein